ADEFQHLAGGEAADFRRSRTGGEARIEAVDIEGEIGRAIADDRPGLLDERRNADAGNLLRMNDRHAGFIGEYPQILRRTAIADLDRPGRVQQAVEDRNAERPAVMELGLVESAARVAMG